jgi:hypothetical protein
MAPDLAETYDTHAFALQLDQGRFPKAEITGSRPLSRMSRGAIGQNVRDDNLEFARSLRIDYVITGENHTDMAQPLELPERFSEKRNSSCQHHVSITGTRYNLVLRSPVEDL